MATAAGEGRGQLFVVATPIGNLHDLSPRARDTLASADRILAEDTRRARVLLGHIGVATRPQSLHAHNEAARSAQARSWLAAGEAVALVSDAGTPLLSDPGERLVHAALDEGCAVIPVPGPSAILAGLAASGLPCVPFTFVGFLPRKAGRRARALERITKAMETTVLFESPGRLSRLLNDLAGLLEDDRRLAVCREMTKVHEEVVRGTAAVCAAHFAESPARGEVTVVVAGLGARRWGDRPAGRGKADRGGGPWKGDRAGGRWKGESRSGSRSGGEPGGLERSRELEAMAADALGGGLAASAAARQVAAQSGVARGDAYQVVLRVKKGLTTRTVAMAGPTGLDDGAAAEGLSDQKGEA